MADQEEESYEEESYEGESYEEEGHSSDSFTEVTHQSWGSRLQEQASKSVIGFVMFLAAFPLLFWNEGRAVDVAKALEEGKGAVIPVTSDAVDASNNGQLIHFSGKATTDEQLADLDFGVETGALKLRRTTEMYQWDEEKEERKEKTSGGGEKTVTSYKYRKTWSENHIDSGSFRKRAGHENPAAIPYESDEYVADRIVVGAFQLSPSLIEKIDAFEEMRLPANAVEQIGGRTVHRTGNSLYVGDSPSSPQIGDLKVRFEIIPTETEVSVVSRQNGSRLEPYLSKTGTVELLQVGLASADLMFNAAEEELAMETWLLRIVGIAMMAIGLTMLFKILETVIDRIPFVGIHIGTVVGVGTTLIAILIALPLALLTIAIAWFFARPIVSIVLLVLAIGGFVGLRKFGDK